MVLKGLVRGWLRRSAGEGGHADARADRAWKKAQELQGRGELGEACRICEQTLEHSPGHARTHHLLGFMHGKRGDLQRALHHLAQAAALAPDWPEALIGYGNVQLMAGALQGAEQSYRAAIELVPDSAAPHYSLGVVLLRASRPQEALASFARAHEIDPARPEFAWELVQLRLEAGEVGEAGDVAERILALAAGSALAHKAAGLVHLRRHEPQAALEHFGRATALAPDDADAFLHQGIAAQELRHFDAALDAYQNVLKLKPDYAPARFRRALLLLLQGDFQRAWLDYEARHRSTDQPHRRFPQPRWSGEPLAGKTLLVYGEQGLGDEIMFASCLPEVLAQARLCVIDCHPKLAALINRSFPGAAVHGGYQNEGEAWVERFPAADYQIPIGSLPGLLRNRREDFPAHAGYLRADPAKVTAWKSRLAALGPGLKVGLSWQGGTQISRARLRSLTLEELRPVLGTQDVDFIDLQYTDTAAERAAFEKRHGIRIVHWEEALADYDETAALIAALDRTLSVCTAVIHLAGALGAPAWVMTPFSPEWRYGHAGEAMAWYPSVRLIRQPRYGDWAPVIATVRERLARAVGGFAGC